MPSLTPRPPRGAAAGTDRRRWLSWVAAFAALPGLALLVGCDAKRIEKLEEGVATEADVRRQFGEPAAIHDDGGGARTLEYTRQPEGQTAYMISIGADGRMSALRQVLRPDVFARITPGMDQAQVRRLIGRPGRTQRYELRREEAWDWRFLDGQDARVFAVTFDETGRVLRTETLPDPRVTEAGGPSR
ncbi:MAG: outer membrane protein assembly factor BamE [Ideonella sp.]|nr:outer membrane protein assembly factor BamE [Ideonella sp.]